MEHVTLIGQFNARIWADEFIKAFPKGCNDHGTMLVWFASAIMTGYDHCHQELNKTQSFGSDLLSFKEPKE